MTQLDLNYQSPIDYHFQKFHESHPEVYELIKKLAYDVLRSGVKRYGIRDILGHIRWHFNFDKPQDFSGEQFKINNNYMSRYVRLLVKEFPVFETMFSTRMLRS